MANRIKGITIEIGGDTTKLDKSLQQINSSIRSTQSQLKDVEKLLKLDPGNAQLLEQRFKLLKQAIEQTEEKLKALKAAESQVDEAKIGTEKYDALQREIIETEENLKKLKGQFDNAAVASQQFVAKGEKISEIGAQIGGLASDIQPVSNAAQNAFKSIISSATEFEANMARVKAITGTTGEEFSRLEEAAKSMSEGTIYSASEVAKGMEAMAMAGWSTEQIMTGLPAVLDVAAASGQEFSAVSSIVTDNLFAFGLQAEDATRLVDVMAKAATSTNTDIMLMGETFKYCAPIAGTLGYTIEDTAVAIGLMANAGIKGSQAGSSMRMIFANLTGTTKKARETLAEYNVETVNSDGTMRALSAVMTDLRAAFSGMTDAEKAQAAEAIAGKRAMTGLLSIMNASDEDFKRVTADIYDYNGAASEMATISQDTLEGSLKKMKASIANLGVEIGNNLLPMLQKLVGFVADVSKWFSELPEGIQDTILVIVGLTAALAPVLSMAANATQAIGGLFQIIGKLGITFGTTAAGAAAAGAALEGEAVAAGTAAAATGTLSTVLAPIGIALAGLAVVIGGVVAAFEVQEQREKAVAEELGPLLTTTDEMIQRQHALAESTHGLTEAAQQNVDTVRTNAEVVKTLAESLMQDIEADNQSAASKALIAEKIAQLNELIPELNLQYDASTNSLNMTKDAIIASADAMVYQAEQAAYAQVLTDAIAAQVEIEKELAANQLQVETNSRQLKDAEEQLAEMENQLNQYQKMTSDEYKKQQELVSTLRDKDVELKDSQLELNKAYQDAQTQVEGAKQVINGTFPALDTEKEKTDEAAKSMDKFGHESEIAAGQVSSSTSNMSGSASSMAGSVNASASSAGQGMLGFGRNAQSGSSTAVNAAYNAKSGISGHLSSLPTSSWGSDMMSGLASGISSGSHRAVNAAYNVASQISALLHFTRPDKGPLRDYEEWMPHMMQGLAKGINQYSYLVNREIKKVATDLTIPNINATAEYSASLGYPSMLTNNSTSNVVLNFGGITWSGESDIEATMDQIQSVISRRGYRLG